MDYEYIHEEYVKQGARIALLDKLERLMQLGRYIEFEYVNHAGKHGTRRLQVVDLVFQAELPHYPTVCWLLRGICQDRKESRSFEVAKIQDARAYVPSMEGSSNG